jgi:hypothetical protein
VVDLRRFRFRIRCVEHVFAEQKDRMGLFIRTVGIVRPKVKIGMANLVCNFKRLIFLQRTPPPESVRGAPGAPGRPSPTNEKAQSAHKQRPHSAQSRQITPLIEASNFFVIVAI